LQGCLSFRVKLMLTYRKLYSKMYLSTSNLSYVMAYG